MRDPVVVLVFASYSVACSFNPEGTSSEGSTGTSEATAGSTSESGSSSSTTGSISTSSEGPSSSTTGSNSTAGSSSTSSTNSSSSTSGGGRYDAEGPQVMVPAEDVVGWEECWTGSFGDPGPEISVILGQCAKANLMLACREAGTTMFTVLAHAPREDVDIFTSGNETHLANGAEWYRTQGAWGFAKEGDVVGLNLCDFIAGPERMCWGVIDGALAPGTKCGLNEDAFGGFERVVLHAD